jgi:CRP/FNR family transcriptional regulator
MNASLAFVESDVRTAPRAPAPLSHTPEALGALELDTLRQHMNVTRRKLTPGQYLYRAGQPFQALYLVHAGFLKSRLVSSDGREQITGFHLRGELLAVDSIGTATHGCDVIALDYSEVWELPYPPVLHACMRMPELQTRLTAALASEIRRDRNWMLALGTLDAEQRVAMFLLDLAQRYQAMGFSPSHFVLRTTRAEMGSFLALKHETVTRALSHLHAQGYIDVDRREVRIRDAEALARLSGGSTRTQ